MIEQMMSSIWTSLAHLPSYGMTIVGAPILALVGIKIMLLVKQSAKKNAKKEWVFGQERDADGMPVLATNKAQNSSARTRRAQQLRSRI
jgi:hypothetical protein